MDNNWKKYNFVNSSDLICSTEKKRNKYRRNGSFILNEKSAQGEFSVDFFFFLISRRCIDRKSLGYVPRVRNRKKLNPFLFALYICQWALSLRLPHGYFTARVRSPFFLPRHAGIRDVMAKSNGGQGKKLREDRE